MIRFQFYQHDMKTIFTERFVKSPERIFAWLRSVINDPCRENPGQLPFRPEMVAIGENTFLSFIFLNKHEPNRIAAYGSIAVFKKDEEGWDVISTPFWDPQHPILEIRYEEGGYVTGECVTQVEIQRNDKREVVGTGLDDYLWRLLERMEAHLRGDRHKRKRDKPTIRMEICYKRFERIKREHPDWTQEQVAMAASEEAGQRFTANTVRYAYRIMGKKWQRGDTT